tara:strand:+ start:1466 stop:3721 length:2256 start_codon:yes stop_codon:yes gene_type:complete
MVDISTYARLALLRGYSRYNPIIFTIDHNSLKFKLVYSEYEPKLAQLPVNVLWLEHNTNVLRRRVSYSASNFHFTWEVTDPLKVFDDEQYYDLKPFDLRDIGFSSSSVVGNASTTRKGLVTLLEPNPSAVVVPDSDPRLDDERVPTDHVHKDFPRTLVKITDQVVGVLGNADHPKPGELLFITKQLDDLKYECEWRLPLFDEIEWFTPQLVSLAISIPDGVIPSDNAKFSLKCDAQWSDRIETNATVLWDLVEAPEGVSISNSGLITCLNQSTDIVVVVRARKQDPFYKHWVSDTFEFEIKNLYDQPVLLEIVGESSMYENSQEYFSFVLHYESGATKMVTPASQFSDYGDLAGGYLAVADVTDDRVVTLSASYKIDSIKLDATHSVAVLKNKIVSAQFVVEGNTPSSLEVAEGSSVFLPVYKIDLRDGSHKLIDASNFEGITSTSPQYVKQVQVASIHFSSVNREQTFQLQNRVNWRGDFATATLNVTLLDVYPFIQSLSIQGSSTLGPNVLSLSPFYKRSGVQGTPTEQYQLKALVEGTEVTLNEALEGMTYNVVWSVSVQKPSLIVAPDGDKLVLQINSSSDVVETFQTTLKASVHVLELDSTLEAFLQVEVRKLDLDLFKGPALIYNNGAELVDDLPVGRNASNDSSVNLTDYQVYLFDSSVTLPAATLPEDTLRFTVSPSNTDNYKYYTQLQFQCMTHTIEVESQKIGYNWRVVLWVRNTLSGETIDITVTDPRINKSYQQSIKVI